MEAMKRKLFVAGSTGATGKVLVPLARARGLEVVAHQRPKHGGAPSAGVAVCELADSRALEEAVRGCTTVVQLIGTVRSRFAAGDTYETSDIGTTVQLLAAAKATGVDHFVLLSSVGAGRPVGAYLAAKAKVEQLVHEAGIPWTVFRPSSLVGGERKAPPGMKGLTRLLGLERLKPITLEELSGAMIQCAVDRAPLGVALEGGPLWELVGRSVAAGD